MAQYFAAGGWTMFPLLLLGLLGLAGTVAAAIAVAVSKGRERLALVTSTMLLGVAVLSVCVGVFGYAVGSRTCLEAVAHVNPADRQVILAAGEAEARVNLGFSLACAALPGLAGLGLFGFGLAGRKKLAPPAASPVAHR